MNKLFSILIEVILVMQVCPGYQPISHKVYLKIAQILAGSFSECLSRTSTILYFIFSSLRFSSFFHLRWTLQPKILQRLAVGATKCTSILGSLKLVAVREYKQM
jgi:hypothetical protein